jgi:hypothetical protein
LAEPTKGIVFTQQSIGVWVESTGVCFQSLTRRSRYSIRPLKFEECDCFPPLKTRFGAPEPLVLWAQLHASGSNLAVCLRAGPELTALGARGNRRVNEGRARRSVAGPWSAAGRARYLRMGDSYRVAHRPRCATHRSASGPDYMLDREHNPQSLHPRPHTRVGVRAPSERSSGRRRIITGDCLDG